MALEYISELGLKRFIQSALIEDAPEGDVSSEACIPREARQKAKLLVKEDCILAGVNLAERVFLHVDKTTKFDLYMRDGEHAKVGEVAFQIEANARSILLAERLVLNCMQRMSGIATLTKRLSSKISHTKAKILDTRKTTPNFRMLEKWAVVIGGGQNHRFDLTEMVMLKDNHIDFAGGIHKAISATKSHLVSKGLNKKIIVEARDLVEVQEIMDSQGVDRVLIDNFSLEDLKKAVSIIGPNIEKEASGGITEESIVEIGETGVDFISVGAVTHSAKNIDLSLKAIK